LKAALFTKKKFERKAAVGGVVKPYLAQIPEEEAVKKGQIKKIVSRLEEELLREVVLDERTRFDGRRLDEIRDIEVLTGVLPRTHGSALFTRGETRPGHRHPRHQPRRPGDRGVRGREHPEVHAALQLPPVLRRRGEVPARPRPA